VERLIQSFLIYDQIIYALVDFESNLLLWNMNWTCLKLN